MKAFAALLALLLASTAQAQTKPKTSAAPVDPCAPIGRTADGRFVYALACDNLPAPPPAARTDVGTAAGTATAAPSEERGGLFRNPFSSLSSSAPSERSPGVGPPPASR